MCFRIDAHFLPSRGIEKCENMPIGEPTGHGTDVFATGFPNPVAKPQGDPACRFANVGKRTDPCPNSFVQKNIQQEIVESEIGSQRFLFDNQESVVVTGNGMPTANTVIFQEDIILLPGGGTQRGTSEASPAKGEQFIPAASRPLMPIQSQYPRKRGFRTPRTLAPSPLHKQDGYKRVESTPTFDGPFGKLAGKRLQKDDQVIGRRSRNSPCGNALLIKPFRFVPVFDGSDPFQITDDRLEFRADHPEQ